jgi:S-adenosylmethionine:tRNA ribosyltransferase-isomerase
VLQKSRGRALGVFRPDEALERRAAIAGGDLECEGKYLGLPFIDAGVQAGKVRHVSLPLPGERAEKDHYLPLRIGGTLDFVLPTTLEAGEPPEARGLARDEVRLLVSHRADNRMEHARFHDIPSFLEPGDLLVINTSGTLNAALPATLGDGTAVELHLSTHLPADPSVGSGQALWVVELRIPSANGTVPFFDATAGEKLSLPAGASATLHVPYSRDRRAEANGHRARLWIATLDLPAGLHEYLAEHGFPIHYSYVKQTWPSSFYQTVYATEPGSAEMPSAGRAFTPEVITRLVAKGVGIAPLVLHTGVASLEEHEPPYEEYYRVPLSTADAVNAAHGAGKRVIAVGTTVVRALETVTDQTGRTHPGEGWTDLMVTPERGVRAANGLLTGFHEPRATHLAMLEAFAGREHLAAVYDEALEQSYLWHEFGDLHLLLP